MKEKVRKGFLAKRAFTGIDVREQEQENQDTTYKEIAGIPIIYDTPTVITEPDGFTYEEVICKGAVQPEAITRDTALYYNHDLSAKPLARVRTGHLTLTPTDKGVEMTARINTERSDAKDLYLAIKDGDISKMSFMFRVEDDEWDITEQGMPKRTIKKIGYIHEVSAVADPAYETTTITARSGETVETISDAVETARAKYKEYKDKEEKRQASLRLAKAKARAKVSL